MSILAVDQKKFTSVVSYLFEAAWLNPLLIIAGGAVTLMYTHRA
jgi:hypothetical protein